MDAAAEGVLMRSLARIGLMLLAAALGVGLGAAIASVFMGG